MLRHIEGLTVAAFVKRISWWGIASVLLLIGNVVIFQYNFHLVRSGQQSLFSTLANYELCVIMQVSAAVCGIVAARRGSTWWLFIVLTAGVMALGCYFSEV